MFVLKDQLALINSAKVGDQVIIPLKHKSTFARNAEQLKIACSTITARIIAKYPYPGAHFPSGISNHRFVLGAKTKLADNFYPIETSSAWEMIPDIELYPHRYLWNNGDVCVDSIVGSSNISTLNADGHWCKDCKNYFAYSEPNQKDGTLICWSCRKFPYYSNRIR